MYALLLRALLLAALTTHAFVAHPRPAGARAPRPTHRSRPFRPGVALAAEVEDRAQQTLLLNNFLTQRAVQTLLFLLRTGRDEVTANWLHRFLNHTGMEHFHGTRGLKVPWDDYVAQLLTADTEEIVASLRKHSGHRLSPGNPYAKTLESQWFNYTVDIFPRDLGERVLSLRAALAAEWIDDLAAVGRGQDELLRAYRDSVRDGEDPLAGQVLPAALEGFDTFIGMGESTAYRGGNYDLLLRLSAQQGVLRTLRRLEGSFAKQDAYSAAFLRGFYDERGRFDGDQPNGVADAFFRRLLDEPPRVKGTLLLDTVAIATDVIDDQLRVVNGWRELLPAVDELNADVRRRALEASFSTLG